jgi:hypothetical protein
MNTLEILTSALVLITGFYAWATYRILKANERAVSAMRKQTAEFIRLEAYDRRLKVYDTITRFIAETLQDGTTDNEKLIEMLRATKHAKFLFDNDDIRGYIDLLYNKGLEYEYKEKEIWKAPIEAREKMANDIHEIRKWFRDQFDIVEAKFEKYLQLSSNSE